MAEQPKFDLDCLLKAKRFEMPDEAFWDAFNARLKQCLPTEVQPRRVKFAEVFALWLRRLMPVATVGLLVFGGVCHFSSRFNASHLEMCFQPSDIRECHVLSFHTSGTPGFAKSVLEKSIASAEKSDFTF